LAVADGMGGQRGGAQASKVAVEVLAERLAEGTAASAHVVDAVDEAQVRTKASRGAGATTLVVTLITPEGVRMFNVGDSEAILLTPRGKVKVRTTVQSPVGYLVAAGALAPDDALLHEYRHLLSSAVGIDSMRLEVCPRVAFGKKDTLVLGSDGMFDNVFEHELLAITRNRSLDAAADELATLVAARMRRGGAPPCKPDDMSFILFRPTPAKAAPKKKRKKKAKAKAKAKPTAS
ncbi:MAG: protein phosphatase 2C domain-containing protein, partial [Nannocystaceae bacterium]|nr:protein phosphatase 2C domain-containing protein [Nannocystaceae bacterium]